MTKKQLEAALVAACDWIHEFSNGDPCPRLECDKRETCEIEDGSCWVEHFENIAKEADQ